MKQRQKLLRDEQWELIEPLFPKAKQRRDRRGRPPAANRACFEGILWILQTGTAWRFLPDAFPSPSTCWRRLQRWQEQGVWLEAWRALLGRWTRMVCCAGTRPFSTAVSRPQKKGPRGRQNQARQGHERDQVVLGILAQLAAKLLVTNLKIAQSAVRLTSPTIPCWISRQRCSYD